VTPSVSIFVLQVITGSGVKPGPAVSVRFYLKFFKIVYKMSRSSTAYQDLMAAKSASSGLDKALGRLKLTPDRIRAIPHVEEEMTRSPWHRGSLERPRNQKYLVEDKKIIRSGDVSLGTFPILTKPAHASEYEYRTLLETWNFVNELYDDLKQAEPGQVRKIKKLRRKIAGPLLLGLHLMMHLTNRKFLDLKANLSEQELTQSYRDGEASLYVSVAAPAWKRFEVVSYSTLKAKKKID
jgi:hypothetical protein